MGGCWTLQAITLQAISQAHIVNNDGVVVRLRLCCKGGMEVNLTNNQTITILYLVYLTWKSLQYCILNKSLINTSTLQKIVWQTIKILLKILILFYSLKKGNNIFKMDINFPSFVYLSTRTHYPDSEPTSLGSFSLMLHT
jgi:hypothetical protein